MARVSSRPNQIPNQIPNRARKGTEDQGRKESRTRRYRVPDCYWFQVWRWDDEVSWVCVGMTYAGRLFFLEGSLQLLSFVCGSSSPFDVNVAVPEGVG